MMMHKALHPMDDINYMFKERKVEEDLPPLMSAEVCQYKDSRNTQKEQKRLITAASDSNGNIRSNRKTTMERKTTAAIIQAMNWEDCTHENLDMAKKGNL